MPNLKQIANKSPSSQGAKELLWLLEKVSAIAPRVILEIGVHQGYSMQAWLDAFPDAYVIGIDNDLHDLKIPMESNRHIIIDGDSHSPSTGPQVVEALDGREIDFMFIDGDHLYNGVKEDFQMYTPLVRRGGIVAFDDMALYDNPSVEVYKFWQEIEDRYPNSESTHDDSNGIGVINV